LANKSDAGEPKAEKANNEEGEDPQDDYGDEEEREIEVTDEEIAAFEKEHNLKVIKTSAKTGNGVDQAFLEMTK
jgi:hypothetical protein